MTSCSVFHGSPMLFQTLKIMHVHEDNTEGDGIYFALQPETAQLYGQYLYTLTLDSVTSFADPTAALFNVGALLTEAGCMAQINLFEYLAAQDLNCVADNLAAGDGRICDLPHHIRVILDNSESFSELSESMQESVYSALEAAFARLFPAYLFELPQTGLIGVIKDPAVAHIKEITDCSANSRTPMRKE